MILLADVQNESDEKENTNASESDKNKDRTDIAIKNKFNDTGLHILCEGKNWQCIVHNHPADYCNNIDFDLKKGKKLKINSCKTSTKNGKC